MAALRLAVASVGPVPSQYQDGDDDDQRHRDEEVQGMRRPR